MDGWMDGWTNQWMSTLYIILEIHIMSTKVSEPFPLFQLTLMCPIPSPRFRDLHFPSRSFSVCVQCLLFTMIVDGLFGIVFNPADEVISCLPSTVLELVQGYAFPKVSPFPPDLSQTPKYLPNQVGIDIRIFPVRPLSKGHSCHIWMVRPEVTRMKVTLAYHELNAQTGL